ncbi:MAG: ATP-binding protein [Spirochaetaceae bacterium]|jgi:predicted AAA+ superfamily ATPase|nr:ATP-binding protein [Spirochaetaceae bacterium]
MYRRDTFLNQLLNLRGTSLIKVITGVRRSGKSSLLELLKEHWAALDEEVVHINMEWDEAGDISDARGLSKLIRSKLPARSDGQKPEKAPILLLDEVQLVPGWERVVNSLRTQKLADIYITGSNAYLLSSELATLLSGRYIEIKMLPLSFKEYLEFHRWTSGDTGQFFQRFMDYGGFPGLYEVDADNDENSIHGFLGGIYNTILVKDTLTRTSIRDVDLLEKIIRFVSKNIGNLINGKKVSDYLVSAGRKTSHETIDTYLNALEKAFFVYRAPRYDIAAKEYLKTQGKYYLVDLGLRYWAIGKRGVDIGSSLENIVYLELLRRGYAVFVGNIGKAEVDFVAIKQDEKQYIQVAYLLATDEVINREFAPLLAIKDNYPKYVLSMDDFDMSHDGIGHKNIRRWLLENV